MRLDEDSFRALARSSPWRWRSLHLTRRGGEVESVEAWIERPGRLDVLDAKGRRHRERIEVGDGRAIVVTTAVGDSAEEREEARRLRAELAGQRWTWACDVSPVVRLDGLVAHRPDDWWVNYDSPMWDDYRWVAMLDPVELADGERPSPTDENSMERCAGTVVTDLRDGEHRGRRAWRAVVAATEAYEPRCGCCPLLWSRISDLGEYGDDAPQGVDYPIGYEIALDVETGIVVELIPLGGERANDTLDVEIHAVG